MIIDRCCYCHPVVLEAVHVTEKPDCVQWNELLSQDTAFHMLIGFLSILLPKQDSDSSAKLAFGIPQACIWHIPSLPLPELPTGLHFLLALSRWYIAKVAQAFANSQMPELQAGICVMKDTSWRAHSCGRGQIGSRLAASWCQG